MCLSAGGADEQHRAGAELPAADQQHRQPVQPAAFLEHVQQVAKYKFLLTHTHTHTQVHRQFILTFLMCGLFQSEGPGDESQWDGDQRKDAEVSLPTQFHNTIMYIIQFVQPL